MSSAFSLAVKPSVAWSNGKLLSRKSTRRAARAEVIVAPKKRTSSHNVPELSKQGIPHTDLHVREIVKRQSTDKSAMFDVCQKPQFHPMFLEEAYERCRNICAEYAKTFYLGTTSLLFFPWCLNYFSKLSPSLVWVYDWWFNPTVSDSSTMWLVFPESKFAYCFICSDFQSFSVFHTDLKTLILFCLSHICLGLKMMFDLLSWCRNSVNDRGATESYMGYIRWGITAWTEG